MFLKENVPLEEIDKIVDCALAEDVAHGDITSEILIPDNLTGSATIQAKDEGVLAGIQVCKRVFIKISSLLDVEILIDDGSKFMPGDTIARVTGNLRSILKAERVALNFLQRLSGIATLTSRYVKEVEGLGVRIRDTRKTTPGLRILEKYAVVCGGGNNHRIHLGDGILIKDNHLAALGKLGIGIADAVSMAKRKARKGMSVEVEVNNDEGVIEAVKGGADTILLDNMDADKMRRVVNLVPSGIRTEASGGITLTNIRSVASAGINDISVGALTHSVKAIDISLEIEPLIFKQE